MTKPKVERALAYLELDTVDVGNADFQRYLRKNKITALLLKRVGPGGWPLYRFTAARRVLLRFVTEIYADEELGRFIKEPKKRGIAK